jgi:hypothetical protein
LGIGLRPPIQIIATAPRLKSTNATISDAPRPICRCPPGRPGTRGQPGRSRRRPWHAGGSTFAGHPKRAVAADVSPWRCRAARPDCHRLTSAATAWAPTAGPAPGGPVRPLAPGADLVIVVGRPRCGRPATRAERGGVELAAGRRSTPRCEQPPSAPLRVGKAQRAFPTQRDRVQPRCPNAPLGPNRPSKSLPLCRIWSFCRPCLATSSSVLVNLQVNLVQ